MTTRTRIDKYIEESQGSADPAANYLAADGDWRDGVRPENVIETPADIEWLFGSRQTLEIRVVCRWCGSSAHHATQAGARRWFLTHPCAKGLAA